VNAAGRRALIEELCSFEGRWPGTDAERRAGTWLAGRLRAMGRRAEVEPTYVHPEYGVVLALHIVLAVAGSLVALLSPPAGFALVLFTCLSLYLDQNTRLYLLRRLLFRRASQNVVSPGRSPGAHARVILTAHYDAAKTGWVFGPRSTRTARGIPERLRLLLGPIRLIFWAGFVPLLLISGLRMAGLDPSWLGLVQLLPTALLLVAFVLVIDISLSKVVPGAYDNASGVAAVLSTAEELDDDPPSNLDVWVVLPGAEECNAEGMAAWFRRHAREIDRERTFFVNLDSLSYGTVHYLDGEGAIVTYGMDRRLRELCAAIADSGLPAAAGARPITIPFHTDALPAIARRFRAISLIGAEEGVGAPYYHTPQDTPDKVDDEALSRAVSFTVELVRAIDRDLARSAPALDSAPPAAAAHQV
jgi:hypothetical protein